MWKSLSPVQLFVTPWTIQSMEFSRPEYWSGKPFPSPGDLPNHRHQTQVSHIAGGFFSQLSQKGSPIITMINSKYACFSQFSSIQLLSHVWFFVTPWTAARQASLSITNSQSWLKLISIELVMPSNHLILCHPLLLPSVFPSIGVFSNESVFRIRWWPKYCHFSFSISPSNEYSGLVSFRIDWVDLLAVLGTLKSLLQHHSSKASILRHSTFFKVQLSHPYMTTGKIIALTVQAFVCKVMFCLLIH